MFATGKMMRRGYGGGGGVEYLGFVARPRTTDSSFTVDIPAGAQEGDLLVLYLTCQLALSFGVPTGWSVWGVPRTPILPGFVAHITLGASIPSTITVTTSGEGIAANKTGGVFWFRGAEIDINSSFLTGFASNEFATANGVTSAEGVLFRIAALQDGASSSFGDIIGYDTAYQTPELEDLAFKAYIKNPNPPGFTGQATITMPGSSGIPKNAVTFSVRQKS